MSATDWRRTRAALFVLIISPTLTAAMPLVSSASATPPGVDAQDEMFFYRDDGLYRYYNISPTGHVGSPILAGDNYTTGWDSITAVDLSD